MNSVNEMVGMTGLEPATPCPPDKCATRLRYIPTKCMTQTLSHRFKYWCEGLPPFEECRILQDANAVLKSELRV